MPDWKPQILRRLAPLKLSPTREAEIAEELSQHLEDRYQELLVTGQSEGAAFRTAIDELKDEDFLARSLRRAEKNFYREPIAPGVASNNFLSGILQDVRYAVRIMRKTPVITAIALLSLALGIGANTAIFSLIDAVMLRMLPVQNPEQLVQIKFRDTVSSESHATVTNPIWEQVRDHQDVFSGAFAWFSTTFDLAEGSQEDNIYGVYASGSYFNVLGVRPAAGRLFVPSDDVRGCQGVAVLGYGFWQSRYAGAQSAIGSFIRLDGHSFSIVGVAQRGFNGTDVGTPLDVAIPICAEAVLHINGTEVSNLDHRAAWWLKVMGRLKPGMTLAQAGARMKVLSPPLFAAVVPQEWSAKNQDLFRHNTFVVSAASTGGTSDLFNIRDQYSQPLEILMIVVGLVLLIACANIASLLLARSAARQKEIAVRLSLGASRARLIRQMLTESLVLSGIGATLGVLFARWGSAFLVHFVSQVHNEIFLNLKMDSRVLAFTIGITLLCGLLFGGLPAYRATRIPAMFAMKEGQVQSGGRSRSAAARWIIAVQVALSLILLVGAGLFIHTFTRLMNADAGFNRENVLMVRANIRDAGIAEPARAELYGQMLTKLKTIPGVLSAAQCWDEPLSGQSWNWVLKIPGRKLPPDSGAYLNWVTPGFFSTMQISLLRGRAFDGRDTARSTHVVVINQLLAQTYFSGQNPIGQHILFDTQPMATIVGATPIEIIGVVRNAKYESLSEDFQPTAYFPLAQIGAVAVRTTFEIRTTVTPTSLMPAVRDAMASVNKLASLQFTTLKQQADDSVIQQSILAALSGFFGGLALLLTAIGLYGVMAYVVTLRTNEIGIRMALGAQQASILRLVMRDAAIVLAAGIAAGLLGAIWITRLVQQFLFGVKPSDPWALALAIVALVAVASVATYIPARRAMRVDPMVALRYE